MTKTKQQLRAEAVERLTKLNEYGYWEFPVHVALCGRDVPDVDEERAIIADLLTDDCDTECYECAKLAELVAENSQLRVKVEELTADVSQAVEDTAERVTNNGEMYDSREKLEADVRKNLAIMKLEGYMFDMIHGWLDRQAAITERHWMEIVGASANANVELKRQIDERQARVDELTEQLEIAHAKNRSLKAHIAKMQEGRHGWHVKGVELQREVDRLTRENISLARDLGECMAERDGLKRENARLSSDEFYLRCTLVDMNGEVVG